MVFFTERDEPVVVAQSRSFCNVVQLDPTSTAAMMKTNDAWQGGKL